MLSASTNQEKKKGVEVIEIRFAVDSESSVHKVFARAKGHTIRKAVQPICDLKHIDIDRIGVYLNDDRSAALPLNYDIYSLTGHVLHVLEYRAPAFSTDQVDGKLSLTKKTDSNSNFPLLSTKTSSTHRAASFAGKNRESVAFSAVKSKTPIIGRKSAPAKDKQGSGSEMYPQRLSTGSAPVTRNTSAAGMLAQPGGRRPRQSEGVPPTIMTSKLLGLSEGSHNKKEHGEDDNGNEKHRKQLSALSIEGNSNSGEVSPGGTLHKSRSSSSKLSIFSMQPQNSKSHGSALGAVSAQQLLVSFIHAPSAEAASVRKRFQSTGDLNAKQQLSDREKLDILADLLQQWEKTGPPAMPPLANISLPKFETAKFEIGEHWTDFIDKTDLTQRQKDQQEALWELLYTESEYIKALYVIYDLFMCCLLNIQNAGVLNEIEVEGMFSNVTELATTNVDFWSSELIAVLEYSREHKCLFNPSLLKPAFTNFGEKFKPYTKYCMEQKRCSEYVKKSYQSMPMFKDFVVWAEAQPQCNRLKLHDLLVKPMQRMTRYGLLLRAIHKKTDEEDVRQDLMDMIKSVDKFVTAVDQTLTRTDEKEKLAQTASRIEPYEAVDLSTVDSECSKVVSQMYMSFNLLSPMPGCSKSQLRYNLMEGPLRLRDMHTKVDIHCILFTDLLLFTKPFKRDKLRIIKPPIRVDMLSIHEMKESSCLLLVHLTDFGVAQAVYTLSGDNISKWAKTFKKAQTLYSKAKMLTRTESERLSSSDADLDDIGFSGPMMPKGSSDVFTDLMDSEPLQPNATDSPEVKRVSSFTSLNGTEEKEELAGRQSAAMPSSVSSPEIGRKHHTLPHNYRHPPHLNAQRKSSSSSVESSATNGEKRAGGARRRRTGTAQRYKTAEAAVPLPSSTSSDTLKSNSINGQESADDRISWQVGGAAEQTANDDSDDEFASAQLNCDTKPGVTISTNSVLPAHQLSDSSSCESNLALNRPLRQHATNHPSRSTHQNSANSFSDLRDSIKPRKISQREILRMRQLQDFLNDSSPGVEI